MAKRYKTQWMPSLSVNYNNVGFTRTKVKSRLSWYDRRQATTSCNVATDPGCSYYRYGVQSADNGQTWGSNIQISDQLILQPTQNDGGVQPCYAGDYDYATAQGEKAFVTWTDGRVAVSGVGTERRIRTRSRAVIRAITNSCKERATQCCPLFLLT